MVWIVTTECEKDCLIPDKKLSTITTALGEKNVGRIIAKSKSDLDIICPSDTVLVETKDYGLVEWIGQTGAKHTGESIQAIKCDEDKLLLKLILNGYGIDAPRSYRLTDDFNRGGRYFVKPLILEDSIGIDEGSLCQTKDEILWRVNHIRETYDKCSIIEDYIDGEDCTVAVVNDGSGLMVLPINIKGNGEVPYLTYNAKMQIGRLIQG